MASLVLSGDTSGSITVSAPAVAGSNTQTLVAVTGTLAPIVSGTAVASTSGTSIDFTGIPSWVKRITVMFSGVSTNGTSIPMLQIGDPDGVEATGYSGNAVVVTSTSTPDSPNSTGVKLYTSMAAAASFSGQCQINNMTGNIWVFSGSIVRSDSSGIGFSSGAKTLSDTLTQVRITTVNGTDTFDAGTINILYE